MDTFLFRKGRKVGLLSQKDREAFLCWGRNISNKCQNIYLIILFLRLFFHLFALVDYLAWVHLNKLGWAAKMNPLFTEISPPPPPPVNFIKNLTEIQFTNALALGFIIYELRNNEHKHREKVTCKAIFRWSYIQPVS